MATTTQRAIYAGILNDLETAADAEDIGVHKDYIYITPVPIYTQSDDRIIQLIPGVPTVETEVAGLGYVEEDFRIAIWARVYLDQANHSTLKLTHSTLGALVTIDEVRQTLIQSTADDLATTPVMWVSGASPVETEDAPGWVYYEDTYRVGYEIVWS